MPEHKRKCKAAETMRVYVPLAENLGFAGLKTELEEISTQVQCLQVILRSYEIKYPYDA